METGEGFQSSSYMETGEGFQSSSSLLISDESDSGRCDSTLSSDSWQFSRPREYFEAHDGRRCMEIESFCSELSRCSSVSSVATESNSLAESVQMLRQIRDEILTMVMVLGETKFSAEVKNWLAKVERVIRRAEKSSSRVGQGNLLMRIALRRGSVFAADPLKLQQSIFKIQNQGQDLLQVLTRMESEFRAFKYTELTTITNGFNNLLGDVETCPVYLGYKKDGTPVSVKMFSYFSNRIRHFHDEIKVLKSIDYMYIISLLGYCEEKDHLALVYEYMPKGSLADVLSDRNEGKGINWSWHFRLQKAYEAAQGLAYLHHHAYLHNHCRLPIIHRDVKPTNILLASDYKAVLAGFGVSMFAEVAEVGTTTVVGTPGYIDPEYFQTGEPTTKSDVYSFGVVLLGLITGRPAIDVSERTHLSEWVKDGVDNGDLGMLVDRRIKDYDVESMWSVTELALECTRATSAERPTMEKVVDKLKDCLSLEDFSLLRQASPETAQGSSRDDTIGVESPDPW